eukprot:gene22275-28851_t
MNELVLNRKEQIKVLEKQQEELDRKQITKASNEFHTKNNLNETIVRDIYPALVVIETPDSRIGMGFFQYEKWLVTNAHVIKVRSEIESGIVLRKYGKSEVLLESEQAYHRPWDNPIAPDIVVIKTSGRASIPSNSWSLDSTYDKSHYFYIDAEFVIHYLSLAPSLENLPMLFRCEDGSSPRPGCSGTPIFSAKMIIGKTSKWKFEIIGALYARCNDPDSVDLSAEQSQKLICSVPIVEDFEQIRQILVKLDSADNYKVREQCSSNIKDTDQAVDYHKLSDRDMTLATAGILEFEAGVTSLDLALPEGLEKLYGSGFYKLEQSYLNLEIPVIKITQTFYEFIDYISQQPAIPIIFDKETRILYQKYWRLDCRSGTLHQYRILQVQDNTGKKIKINGKSASSVFAEVKIPINLHKINGEPLADDLLVSQEKVRKGEVYPSVVVSDENDQIKLKKYELTKKTLGPDTLFNALKLSTTDGFKTIQQEVKDKNIELINSVNDDENTPLMVLLQKPLTDDGQRNKAKLLSKYSIWNQSNKNGETARNILEKRGDVNTLKKKLGVNF